MARIVVGAAKGSSAAMRRARRASIADVRNTLRAVAFFALVIACGCRSGVYDATSDGGQVEQASYALFGLPTGLQRIAIAKYVPARRLCSVVVLVFGTQSSSSSLQVPDGWAGESAQLRGDVDRCTTDFPSANTFWPASISGAIEFPSGTPQFPCSASIDATLVSFGSLDGRSRPANVPATEPMRASDIAVEGACAP